MSSYIHRVVEQVKTDARDYDVTANVLTGGDVGQTLSMRAALGDKAGIWRWCILCRLLSWFVQRNHCAETLNPDSVVPVSVYWRAGVCFALVTMAAIAVIGTLIHWGIAAACAVASGAAAVIGPIIHARPGEKRP